MVGSRWLIPDSGGLGRVTPFIRRFTVGQWRALSGRIRIVLSRLLRVGQVPIPTPVTPSASRGCSEGSLSHGLILPQEDTVAQLAADSSACLGEDSSVRHDGTVTGSITPSDSESADKSPAVDELCVAAVDIAEQAARAVSPDAVGEYLGCQAEGERLVTHRFASSLPGYRGWCWAVTVVRAGDDQPVTVNDVVLLPGPDALLAPKWVPWSDRLRPGDLGIGDILPTAVEDPRLDPAYVLSDDPTLQGVHREIGVGRVRVMSRLGRCETAERWHGGDYGPEAPMAREAPGRCATCGFFLPLAGSLGAMFGACGNEFSPADAHVVSVDHGCGAHSEALKSTSEAAAVITTVIAPSDTEAAPTLTPPEAENPDLATETTD